MRTIIYNTLDINLYSQWRELWNKCSSHFFNSPYWFEACSQTFKFEIFYIVTCYSDNNELIGIMPLIWGQKWGGRCLRFPGARYLDKCCVLIHNDNLNILDNLLAEAKKISQYLYLAEMPQHYILSNSLNYFVKSSICPYIQLQPDPFQGMNKKKARRKRNKYKKLSEKAFIKIYQGQQILAHMQAMYEIETKSSKPERKANIFHIVESRKLFEAIVGCSDVARLAFLELDNEKIAHVFSLKVKSFVLDYHTAFIKNYKALSPGNHILFGLIQYWSEDEKAEIYDLSRGLSDQKNDFTNQYNIQYDVFITEGIIPSFLVKIQLYRHKIVKRIKVLIKNLVLHPSKK